MTIDFKADMNSVFLGSEFAETISYNGSQIPAIVDRGNIQTFRGNTIGQGSTLSKFKIQIRVSKTNVPAVVIREDIVIVPHHGRAADTLRVQSIISEDLGEFVLGLA